MQKETRAKLWFIILGISISVPTIISMEYFNRIIDTVETTMYVCIPGVFSGMFCFGFLDSIEDYYFNEQDYETFLNDNTQTEI
jgi:hypothetical protein